MKRLPIENGHCIELNLQTPNPVGVDEIAFACELIQRVWNKQTQRTTRSENAGRVSVTLNAHNEPWLWLLD